MVIGWGQGEWGCPFGEEGEGGLWGNRGGRYRPGVVEVGV